MPSQKQVQWAQLRVGITVVVAFISLAILILLMNSNTGWFTKTITVHAYFDNSGGLKEGAPVSLQGVNIGSVKNIRYATDEGHKEKPVEVTMKLGMAYRNALYKKSTATLKTTGVLGDTFVDIDSQNASGPLLADGDTIQTIETPGVQSIVESTQNTVERFDIIVGRLDSILEAIQDQKGTVGKIVYDPTLINQINQTLASLQKLMNAVSSGQGTVGKLVASDELYNKMNGSVDHLNRLLDSVEHGEGTIGKFMNDPSLYNNANQAIAKTNRLLEGVEAGHGAAGMLVRDEAFAKKLNDTMSRLQSIMDKVDSGQGTMGKLFNDDAVYKHLDSTLVETHALVQGIRENPTKYLTIHMKIF